MAKKKGYMTTQRHYEKFKRFCRNWIEEFDLQDWTWNFLHLSLSEQPDSLDSRCTALACAEYSFLALSATIGLSKNWGIDEPTDDRLNRYAMHEVAHVLLARMHHIFRDKDEDSDGLNRDIHRIIARMESLYFSEGSS